ncbi:MAG: SLC13 family permease [Bacillota bacterium]|nr:SLC13 family permease [Bacillota bacterium]
MHIKSFLKNNIMMLTAFIAAALTVLFVPVDRAYKGYFDYKTLTCLFCVLAVVCALRDANFFYVMANRIVVRFRNVRACIVVLVYITFIGSMLITNDTALLTFLPLGYFVLKSANKEEHLAFTFIMQNMAANLGGMLTPFGNPQNLYLYTKFNIPTAEFVGILLPPFIVSILLITVCCLFVKPTPMELSGEKVELKARPTAFYLALFLFSVAIVLRLIPFWAGLIVIPLALIFTDRHALKSVDYSLLLTFVFFFVFAGNMARIDAVRDFFSMLMAKNALLCSALCSQVISNVPSAILLSRFTANYADLLVGVNIGGAGTLIASLASLITYHEYLRHRPEDAKGFIIKFSIYNFSFLAILLIFTSLI